ncbi:MAG: hypothetical protein K9K76_05070, partial [Halanaerobiales bacterium]|nr:hypothetical protein [Halanaerobiales bacterium]
ILIPGKCLISRHHGSYFNMLEGLSSLIRAYPSSKPKKPCIKPCNLNISNKQQFIKNEECLNCFKCQDVCKVDAITYKTVK